MESQKATMHLILSWDHPRFTRRLPHLRFQNLHCNPYIMADAGTDTNLTVSPVAAMHTDGRDAAALASPPLAIILADEGAAAALALASSAIVLTDGSSSCLSL
jgi:hypothetical protein